MEEVRLWAKRLSYSVRQVDLTLLRLGQPMAMPQSTMMYTQTQQDWMRW